MPRGACEPACDIPLHVLRPEEDALPSKGIDDVFISKFEKIDIGYEDNRGAPFFFHMIVEIAVDLYFH